MPTNPNSPSPMRSRRRPAQFNTMIEFGAAPAVRRLPGKDHGRSGRPNAGPKEVSNTVTRPDWCIRAQFMAAEALDQLIRLNWLPNPLVSGRALSVASF
jgi:hypothetical protein